MMNHMPRTACALYAFKHAKDKNYLNKAIQTDSMILKCDSLGYENPQLNIYLIELSEKNNGFFAVFHKVLKHLYYADRFHLTPVILFTEDFLYKEDHPINGSENPFEYYYEQPGGVSVDQALKSRNVFKAEYIHTCINDLTSLKNGDYEVTDDYIELLGKIAEKYIHMNAVTKERIEQDILKLGIDDKTLGVHFRGTDYKRGFSRHPVYIGINEYIKKTEEVFAQGEYNSIFLASDDKEVVKEFDLKFPGKIKNYKDVFRGDGDVSVAFSQNNRKDHHYLLGMEVLRDMYTLSMCGGLVAGVSQVSLSARITKTGRGEKYKSSEILFHGVSDKGTDDKDYYLKYGGGR